MKGKLCNTCWHFLEEEELWQVYFLVKHDICWYFLDLAEDFQQDVLREIQRRETLFLEERARQESQEVEKRKATAPTEEDMQQDELHELVQQQFMATVHRKETRTEEEKERNLRLLEEELQDRYAR